MNNIDSLQRLTVPEVAKILGVSIANVYQKTSKGIIPHSKPNGKTIYFKTSDIEAYLNRGYVMGQDELEKQATKLLARISN